MEENKNKKPSNRIDSDFEFILSHELKAPLSVIKWYLDLLRKGDAGEINTQQKEIISEIYQNNEHIIHLLDTLTDAAAIVKGKTKFQNSTFAIKSIVQDVISNSTPFAKAKNISLNLSFDPDASTYVVNTDQKRIQKTISNFVRNAIKYSKSHETVEVKLKMISGSELRMIRQTPNYHFASKENKTNIGDGQYIVFEVSDTGIGIPAEQQEKVFTQFFRADNAIKESTSGIGLGLFLDMMVVHASNGFIWFTSEQDRGSTFSFALPLVPKEKEEPHA